MVVVVVIPGMQPLEPDIQPYCWTEPLLLYSRTHSDRLQDQNSQNLSWSHSNWHRRWVRTVSDSNTRPSYLTLLWRQGPARSSSWYSMSVILQLALRRRMEY